MAVIKIYRIKDEISAEFYRVLVDRLWPRGIPKDQAPWDVWFPELAPSTQLRRYFHTHQDDMETFRMQYLQELKDNSSSQLQQLFKLIEEGPVVLLTANHNIEHSQVPILQQFLEKSEC